MKKIILFLLVLCFASSVFGQEPIAVMKDKPAPFSGVLVSEQWFKDINNVDKIVLKVEIAKVNESLKLSEGRVQIAEEKYLKVIREGGKGLAIRDAAMFFMMGVVVGVWVNS